MISARTLRRVSQGREDWEWAERLKRLMAKLRRTRKPLFLTLNELEPILRYKLRRQYGRKQVKWKYLSNDMVVTATRASCEIASPDRLTALRVKVGILSALPGVGKPVASAVLAMVDPEEHAIIDVRAWLQVFGTPKKTFSDPSHTRPARRWCLAARSWPSVGSTS